MTVALQAPTTSARRAVKVRFSCIIVDFFINCVFQLATVIVSAHWTTSATPRPDNANAERIHTGENVTNAEPASGASPTANVAIVTDMPTRANHGPVSALRAETTHTETTARNALRGTTAIRKSVWASPAGRALVQVRRDRITRTRTVVRWTRRRMASSASVKRDMQARDVTFVLIITTEIRNCLVDRANRATVAVKSTC